MEKFTRSVLPGLLAFSPIVGAASGCGLRYTSTGTLDATFGSDGTATLPATFNAFGSIGAPAQWPNCGSGRGNRDHRSSLLAV